MIASTEPCLGPISDLSVPGQWESFHARPGDDLTGLVLGYDGYREHVPQNFVHRMPASTFFPLIIDFAGGWRIHPGDRPAEERTYGTFTAGLIDRYTVVKSSGKAACMQVDFTPFGARAFFGLPLAELTSLVVPLDDLLGRAAIDLADRLYAASDWPARFRIVDGFVRRRLGRAGRPRPEILRAWRRLVASRGCVRIGEVAAELDWSRKHLVQTFHAEIGHRPKAIARIMRFDHALALAYSAPPDWADIAYTAGYADQAHLIREFRLLAGRTPAEILATPR